MAKKALMTEDAFSYDDLIAGYEPDLVTDTATLLSGQNLKRGTLLGKITSGGKLKISAVGAGDGSENPYAILAEDTDASSGDQDNTLIYIGGAFNINKMTFGTDHTAASVKDALRDLGIVLKDAVEN
jgi:hypothetical protein